MHHVTAKPCYLVLAAAVVFAPAAMAKGPFDGLEMDVIAPGQMPKGPTKRIALPRAPGASTDSASGATGYQDSIADSLINGESAPITRSESATGLSVREEAIGAGVARPAEAIVEPLRPPELLPPEPVRPPELIAAPIEPIAPPETNVTPPARPMP